MTEFLDWLFVDWEDTTRRAIYTVGQSFVGLSAVSAFSDIDLALLDTVGLSATVGVLSVLTSGIRGQWNTRRNGGRVD